MIIDTPWLTLIALTVPELRRLLNTLIRTPRPDLDHTGELVLVAPTTPGPSPRMQAERRQAPPDLGRRQARLDLLDCP